MTAIEMLDNMYRYWREILKKKELEVKDGTNQTT